MGHRNADDLQYYVVGLKELENGQIQLQFLTEKFEVKFQLIMTRGELQNLVKFLQL